MKLKKRYLLLSILVYIGFIAAYAVWFNLREEKRLMNHIDERLLAAAKSLKYMLAPDFHDRALSADAIDWEEIERNRVAISEYAFETEFEYLYTLVEKDGKFYFSAPTVTPEEYAEQKSWYFYPYEDVPGAFRTALEEYRPIYVTYTDRWGTFRSVALPQTSPGGNRYLSCADYNIGYVSSIILGNYTTSLLTALFFLALTIPFVLVYRKTLIAHNTELRAINSELRTYRDHLESQVSRRTADLEQAKLKAEEANRLKSRLLFNVSHELRTPLNGIVGYCEALRDTADINLARSYGDIIHRESDILLALINDLLDMAKIEAGKMTISETPFNLRDLVRDTLRGQARLAEKKHLTFRWWVDDRIPNLLRGDSLRIRQVLLNLVSNAVKFTEAGSVDIRVEQADRRENVLQLLFSVKDTGMGIPEDKLSVIFESFSQVDPAITRRYGGTGLGVSIAHRLVELMHGRMTVESEEGKGSEFTVTIPLKECRLTEKEAEALAADPGNLTERNLTGSGHVLLVDDYPTNLSVMELFLQNAGYTTSNADNGSAAVYLCTQKAFDCIFMDIQMPGLDGYEATSRIRNGESRNKKTPVIGLSASIDESTRKKCHEAGMNDFLLKPVKKTRLLSLTSYWTGRRETHRPRDITEPVYGLPTPDTPVILNYRKALINFEHDRTLYLSALKHFTVLITGASSALRHLAEGGDREALFREAHKIKGAASLIGAEEIYAVTQELEKAGRCREDNNLDPLIENFEKAAGAFLSEAETVEKEMET